jgi:phospholipid transport system substrate-binding protein
MFADCKALMLTVALAAAAPTIAQQKSVDASGPGQLISSSSKIMLDEISTRRAEFRKDPAKLYKLVDETLLPYFDTAYAADRVLARHGSTATPQQRKRFVDAFYKSLLYQYGDALVEFTPDRLEVLPARLNKSGTGATVPTKVRRSNGESIPVNYTLRKTPNGWKAWDVTIEGISYIKSFQEDFGAEISQKGLDAVIQRLEAKNAKIAPASIASKT